VLAPEFAQDLVERTGPLRLAGADLGATQSVLMRFFTRLK
jgi:hypothetical protein